MTSKTLVAIRSDDYHAIKLSHVEYKNDSAVESLTMTIKDGGGAHVFTFADAHELETFAKRLLEQAQTIIG